MQGIQGVRTRQIGVRVHDVHDEKAAKSTIPRRVDLLLPVSLVDRDDNPFRPHFSVLPCMQLI